MKTDKILNALVFTLIFIVVSLFIISKNDFLMDKTSRLMQSIRFKTITKNMQTKKLENITYYYSNKSDETYINTIKEFIRKGEGKTAPLLGQATKYPLNIIMFTTSEEFGKVFKVDPKESQAVTIYDSLYVPCENINSYVLLHEYTHYKISSFCKEKDVKKFKVPSWFEEGVAEYASSTLFPGKFKNPKIEKIQDFRNLDRGKQMWEHNENNQGPYMQSYIAIKKIIELKGKDSVQQILINSKYMAFYNSFEKVVGLSIDEFQKLFEKYQL